MINLRILQNHYNAVAAISNTTTPIELAKEMVQSLVEERLRNVFISVDYLVRNGHVMLDCWLAALNLVNDSQYWKTYITQLEQQKQAAQEALILEQEALTAQKQSEQEIPLTEKIKKLLSPQYKALGDICSLMPASIERNQVMSGINRLVKKGVVERQTSFGKDIEPNFRLRFLDEAAD
jgi:hypothetical protein